MLATPTATDTTKIRIPIPSGVPLPSSTNPSNGANTSNGDRSLVPVLPYGLHGIVSDKVYTDFCCTMNIYINSHDSILTRRKKIVSQQRFSYIFLFALVIIFSQSFMTEQPSMWKFLNPIVRKAIFFAASCLLVNHEAFSHVRNQRLIVEQNKVYRSVNIACMGMSQRVTRTLPSFSPVTNVTCSFGSKVCTDWIGSYHIMDNIEFFITTSVFENTKDGGAGALERNHVVVVRKEDDQTFDPQN